MNPPPSMNRWANREILRIVADASTCSTPSRMIIEKSHSLACNSCLVEIQKWNGEEVAR